MISDININTQLCGAAFVAVMLFFAWKRNSLKLRTWRAFSAWLIASMLCLLADTFAIVCATRMKGAPSFVTVFSCKAYLSSLQIVALCAPLYALSGQEKRRLKPFRFAQATCFFFAALNIAITCALPIQIFKEGQEVWISGAASIATYISVGVFFSTGNLLAFFVCSKKRHWTLETASLIFLAAAILHIFFRTLLIVSFSNAITALIMFLALENPELLTDGDTGLWDKTAAMLYMQDLFLDEKKFCIVSLWIENASAGRELLGKAGCLLSLKKALAKYKEVKLFKTGDDEIYLITLAAPQARETLERAVKEARQAAAADRRFKIEGNCLKDSSIAANAEEVSDLLQYARWRQKRIKTAINVVDETVACNMAEDAKVETELDLALLGGRVEPHFQPIWSFRDNAFVSAEALARMNDSEGNSVPPARFIPIAERSGMIARVGEVIFRKACEFFVNEHLAEYGVKFVEVNLSAAQCSDAHLAEKYLAIMEECGVDPCRINLEITETAALASKDVLLKNMKALSERGVSFSLDDFGTGRSNLDYLAAMPVDIVKFDRELSLTYFRDKKGAHVMSHAIGMAQALGNKVVVEGIEEEEQLHGMAALGVDYIQGYYFSRPLEKTAFLNFIRERNPSFA